MRAKASSEQHSELRRLRHKITLKTLLVTTWAAYVGSPGRLLGIWAMWTKEVVERSTKDVLHTSSHTALAEGHIKK